MRRIPTRLIVMTALCGCVRHHVEVRNPAGDSRADAAVVGTSVVSVFASPDEIVEQSPQPIALRVDAWRRDDEGDLRHWSGQVRTPRAWWQRFPCDLATDLWPGQIVSAASADIACVPFAATDPAVIAAAARRDGYARMPETR